MIDKQEMLLSGKYIIVNEKNLKQIITYLFSLGYIWRNTIYVKSAIHWAKDYMMNREILYITIDKNMINFEHYEFLFEEYIFKNYKFVDINILLREYKLKRILK